MYRYAVVLLMLLLPAASVAIDAVSSNESLTFELIGKWFVFWAIGVRLLTAGIRQIAKPGLTSEGILGIKGTESWVIVRELGFANVAFGVIGIVSLWEPEWRHAAALAGGLFLMLDGILHATRSERDADENLAMVSDLWIGLLMAAYLISEI